jgi:hypothetical protein
VHETVGTGLLKLLPMMQFDSMADASVGTVISISYRGLMTSDGLDHSGCQIVQSD